MIHPRLKQLLDGTGMQLQAVAALLGKGQQEFSHMIHGRRQFPPEQVPELARVLKTTADELMPILYPMRRK